jgi:hypothetical protein
VSDDEPEVVEDVVAESEDEAGAMPVRKKTRRGSRGGRNRKKPGATIHVPGDDLGEKKADEPAAEEQAAAPEEPAAEEDPTEAIETTDGDGAAAPKKRTRRGSRGGRNRKKKPAAEMNGDGPVTALEPAESEAEPEPENEVEPESAGEPERAPANGEWDYVPMSEWGDEIR